MRYSQKQNTVTNKKNIDVVKVLHPPRECSTLDYIYLLSSTTKIPTSTLILRVILIFLPDNHNNQNTLYHPYTHFFALLTTTKILLLPPLYFVISRLPPISTYHRFPPFFQHTPTMCARITIVCFSDLLRFMKMFLGDVVRDHQKPAKKRAAKKNETKTDSTYTDKNNKM